MVTLDKGQWPRVMFTKGNAPALSQIYPYWNWNSKLNTKLRLEFQVEYGFKLEF